VWEFRDFSPSINPESFHAGERQQQRIGCGQRQTGMNSTCIPIIVCVSQRSGKFHCRLPGTATTFTTIPEKNLFNRDKSSKLPESLNRPVTLSPRVPD
jgi:hypothetical protein